METTGRRGKRRRKIGHIDIKRMIKEMKKNRKSKSKMLQEKKKYEKKEKKVKGLENHEGRA